MAPLLRETPGPPDPSCRRCSKPITRGTAAQVAGRPVHLRCLASETRLRAIEQQDLANRARDRAAALVARASELLGRPRKLPSVCPACQRPLTDGRGVLFQGDRLVHAMCWRPERGGPGGAR